MCVCLRNGKHGLCHSPRRCVVNHLCKVATSVQALKIVRRVARDLCLLPSPSYSLRKLSGLSLYFSLSLYIYIYIHLSFFLFPSLSISLSSLSLSIFMLSLSLSLSVSLCLSLSLSLSLSLFFCQPVSSSLSDVPTMALFPGNIFLLLASLSLSLYLLYFDLHVLLLEADLFCLRFFPFMTVCVPLCSFVPISLSLCLSPSLYVSVLHLPSLFLIRSLSHGALFLIQSLSHSLSFSFNLFLIHSLTFSLCFTP